MKFWTTLLIFIMVMGSLSCKKKSSTEPEAVTIEDLLVKDNEISGWKRAGDFWVANSSSQLYEYIDGAGDPYIQNGFIEGAYQSYEGKVLEDFESIYLSIFDLAKSENTLAAFEIVLPTLSSPIDWTDGPGETNRIERFPLSQRILYRKGKYVVDLTIDSGLDEALDALKTFAANVASKM